MADILIIDDEPEMRFVLTHILQGAGHSVREAQDGREAIDEFRRKRPALIISDILMPNVEGIETISTLRREEPSIPIIAISGGVAPLYLQAAAKLGATASLEKPFSVDALRSLVEKLLADCNVDSS